MLELQTYEAQPTAVVAAQLLNGMDATERANIDVQVSTAKAYPRDLMRCINNSIAIATLDSNTAEKCGYALPRGGKPIVGPSVHLAKILAQQYGNLRAEAKVVQITDSQIVSRGTAWDLESNYAVAFEVRRSIVSTDRRTGKTTRYSDDMITVTGNAANAIAFRNAVFSLIPKGITDKVYSAAQRMITGDLSDEDKLIKRRDSAIRFFRDEYGLTEEEVVLLCGKQTVNQIKADEIALLLGMSQSLKDGDTTVEELRARIHTSKEYKEQQKSKLSDIARRAAGSTTEKPKGKGKAADASDAEDDETVTAAEIAAGSVDPNTGEVPFEPVDLPFD